MELVYGKNEFNLANIFVLRLFKMVANRAEYSKLEQKSVIKVLVAEKCKPWEIYKKLWDVYRETSFSKKKKKAKMGFSQQALVKMRVDGLSGKEKVLGAAVDKGHTNSLLGYERTSQNWFSGKGASVNSAAYC